MDTLLYVGGMPGRSYQVGVSRERYIDGWVREGEACMKGDQVVHKNDNNSVYFCHGEIYTDF